MSSIFRVIRRISQTWPTGIPRSYKCCSRKLSTASGGELLPPSSTAAPWLMLPPAYSGGTMAYNFYSPSKGGLVSFINRGGKDETEFMQDYKTRLVGSSHGWLALFNERSGDFFISNPLSGRRLKLPPVCGKPTKVIISCSPDDEQEECCHALMIYGPNDRLAFCCPGRSSNEWTRIGAPHHNCGRARFYADFVYSTALKRLLCVLADQDFLGCQDLECWDVGESASASPRMDWKDASLGWYDRQEYSSNYRDNQYRRNQGIRYLVYAEQSNQLYVVTRYTILGKVPEGAPTRDLEENKDIIYPKTIGFCVHRIEGGGNSRCLADSLDGLVMFVGTNHSFALPASEFPQLKPDSIYFTNQTPTMPNYYTYAGQDIGVFDYENKTWSSCPVDLHNFKMIHPTPTWYTPSPH